MNIQNVICGLHAGVEIPAPLVNGIINNTLFHFLSHIDQTLLQITHIQHFRLVDLLLNYAPGFVVNLIDVMVVRQRQLWRNQCMATGFIQLSSIANHQTFRPRRRYMIRTIKNWEILSPALLALSVPPSQPHFLRCARTSACHCHMLRAIRNLVGNVSSLPFVSFSLHEP